MLINHVAKVKKCCKRQNNVYGLLFVEWATKRVILLWPSYWYSLKGLKFWKTWHSKLSNEPPALPIYFFVKRKNGRIKLFAIYPTTPLCSAASLIKEKSDSWRWMVNTMIRHVSVKFWIYGRNKGNLVATLCKCVCSFVSEWVCVCNCGIQCAFWSEMLLLLFCFFSAEKLP